MQSVTSFNEQDWESPRPYKKQRTSRDVDESSRLLGESKLQNRRFNFQDYSVHDFDFFSRFRKVNPVSDKISMPESEILWSKMLEKLVEYKTKHGDVNVPNDFHDHELVTWILEQRKDYQNGTLSSTSLARLKELDFNLDAAEDKDSEFPGTEHGTNSDGDTQAKRQSQLIDSNDIRNGPQANLGKDHKIKNPYAKRPAAGANEIQKCANTTSEGLTATVHSEPASGSLFYALPPRKLATPATRKSLVDSLSTSSSPKTILDHLGSIPNTPECTKNYCNGDDAVINGDIAVVVSPSAGISPSKEVALEDNKNTDDTSKDPNPIDDKSSIAGNEVEEESLVDDILGGDFFSSTVEAFHKNGVAVLHKSGQAVLFFLYKSCWTGFFSIILLLVTLFGISVGVGISMGFMILIGKIDIPAVNDALGISEAQ